MKSTTQGYKDILASGAARKYLIKIDLILADNTVLHLTEADIWEDSFAIETASSGTSTFDIGSAVIGKCKFTINNIDGDFDNYDFFNASAVVWLGLVGDTVNDQQQYYRMGFYTIDEPSKANGLISLELLDNMWKFDVPFSSVNITYPATIRTIIQAICSYCGVSLSANSQTFNGYNFSISEAPDVKDDMNCREVLQYLAMIGCNFCIIDSTGYLVLRWYDVNYTTATTDVFEYNQSTSFGTEDIEITGVKFVIDDTAYTRGTAGYVLELENPFVNASNVSSVLNLIWNVLENFTLRTFNLTAASDLAAEIGDRIKIRDYKGNYVYSWITLNSFKLASHIIQCNAQSPQRTLVKRYSKEVRAAVEVARQAADEVISNYDLAVQMMNSLAVNAMGGYEDYEDAPTGGRIWYLSNMPITKTGGVCSFETGSTVYKKSGDGFFVSRDGGQTWVNGYNMSTGELVVNVLDAIGINFDWARGGTLTLGGYGNGNGILSILNSSNVEKVHGDNDGIKVGGTTGSRIHITTDGTMEYDYDNAYGGKIRMRAVNYGTEQDPDIRDTLVIEDFNDIGLRSDNEMSEIYLSTQEDGQTGYENGYVKLYGHKQVGSSSYEYSELMVDGNGIHLDGSVFFGYSQGISVYRDIINPSDWHRRTLNFQDGGLIGDTDTNEEVPHVSWHRWSSGQQGVYFVAVTLVVGSTTYTFPELDSDDSITYEPHIKCASGVSAPQIEDMVRTGNSLAVTFTAVTAAQAGGAQGEECVMRLLRIKG